MIATNLSELDQAPDYFPMPLFEVSVNSLSVVLPDLLKFRVRNLPPESNKVVFLQGQESLRALENLTARPEMPFWGVNVSSMNISLEQGQNRSMSRQGIRAGLSDAGNEYVMLHITPIVAICNVVLVSTDLNHITQGALAWLEHAETLSPVIETLKPLKYQIPIKCKGITDLNFSDSKNDENQTYQMQFSMELHTYTGHVDLVPAVKEVFVKLIPTTNQEFYNLEKADPQSMYFSALDPDFISFKVHMRRGR